MEILTIKDLMELLQCSREQAIKIANMKGCPKLPREKEQHYKIPKAAFMKWWESGVYK